MNFISFIAFGAICTATAFALAQLFIVFPQWKKYRIQKAATSLAKCLKVLNSDSLPNAKIKNGHYLHDRFYRLVFSVFMCDKPVLKSPANITYDEAVESDMNTFRREIDNLDPETKKVIDEALFAITQLVFLNDPIRLLMCMLKSTKSRRDFKNTSLKNRMVKGGEYLTVRDGISFDNPCHA